MILDVTMIKKENAQKLQKYGPFENMARDIADEDELTQAFADDEEEKVSNRHKNRKVGLNGSEKF